MIARLWRGLLWATAGYVVGAAIGYALTMTLSTNTHDRSLEAVMTAAFVVGPICALAGLVFGLLHRPNPGR